MSAMKEKMNRYKEDVDALSGVLPGVAETYHRFTGACFEPGELDAGTKHLIALGVALFANNEVCTYYHAGEALDHGVTARQVMEAAAVAAAACGGHALSQGVTRVLEELGPRAASGRTGSGADRRGTFVAGEDAGQNGRNGPDGWFGASGASETSGTQDSFPNMEEVSPSF